jgi:peptide/nickel transport system ATP-binding protein
MRQRVMIAIALSCNPRLLIADEATTALDVTIQAQIVDLVKRLTRERGTAVIWISHDLGVIAGLCHRVNVMYAGRIVESGPIRDLFHRRATATRSACWARRRGSTARRSARLTPIEGLPPNLIDPIPLCPFLPRCRSPSPPAASARRAPDLRPTATGRPASPTSPMSPLLQVEDLTSISPPGCTVKAVDGLSFSGRARPDTRAWWANRAAASRRQATASCSWSGRRRAACSTATSISAASGGEALRRMRRKLQIIFQDSHASLIRACRSASWSARRSTSTAWRAARRATRAFRELLDLVGLAGHLIERYPHELSGGQAQRVAICRALAVEPELIVCDEAVSALDVSIQAQIVNLLQDLQERLGAGLHLHQPLTSAWCATSATRSRSCISARSSRWRPRSESTPCPPIPTPRR